MKLHPFEIGRLQRLGYQLEDLRAIAHQCTDTHVTIDENDPRWIEMRNAKQADRRKPKRKPRPRPRTDAEMNSLAVICSSCEHCKGFNRAADSTPIYVKCEHPSRRRCCGEGFNDQSLRTGTCERWPDPVREKLYATPGWREGAVRDIRIDRTNQWIEVTYKAEPAESDWVPTLVAVCDVVQVID